MLHEDDASLLFIFMFCFFMHHFSAKTSTRRLALIGSEVKMSQSRCWIAYVVRSKVVIIHLVNLKGTDVLRY